MEFVRIYISQELLRTNSECKLFGTFQVNSNKTSFYIASETPSACDKIHFIGKVGFDPSSNDIRERCFLDFIPADQSIRNSSIQLRSIKVDGQLVNSKVKIQFIIFDYSQILSISAIDISPDRRTFDEEFVYLLNTIHNANSISNGSGFLPHTHWKTNEEPLPITSSCDMGNDAGSRFDGFKSSFSAIRNTAVFQHLIARQIQFKRLDRYYTYSTI